MRPKFSLLALLFASTSLLKAQSTFEKYYGGTSDDALNSMQQTSDGGFILGGVTESFGTDGGLLVKTDSNGNTLWEVSKPDQIASVHQTSDGGYILAGNVYVHNAYLLKTDSAGNSLWKKTYGVDPAAAATSVRQTTDGGYIFTGWEAINGYQYHAYVVRTDSDGDVLWSNEPAIGNGLSFGNCIRQTSDGNFILTGFTNGNLGDIYIAKLNDNGDTLWTKIYGSQTAQETGQSVSETSDGEYVIIGYDSIGTFLLKTNSTGDMLWYKHYNTDILSYRGYDVMQTTDGGYILTAVADSNFTGVMQLIKTDANGDAQFSKLFDGYISAQAYAGQQTFDGGYAIGGYSEGYDGLSDFYFVKTDDGGDIATAISNYEILKSKVILSPNPFSLKACLRILSPLPSVTNYQFKIFDVLGNEVRNSEFHSLSYILDRCNLIEGIYFYQVQSANEIIGSGKITIVN